MEREAGEFILSGYNYMYVQLLGSSVPVCIKVQINREVCSAS